MIVNFLSLLYFKWFDNFVCCFKLVKLEDVVGRSMFSGKEIGFFLISIEIRLILFYYRERKVIVDFFKVCNCR